MNAQKKAAPKAQSKPKLPFFNLPRAEPVNQTASSAPLLMQLWQWLRARFAAKVNGRRLQVTASVPLGEKRFVAVVKVDGREFLVGGGATNVALLASLDGQQVEFSDLLNRSVAQEAVKPAVKTRKRTTRPAAVPVAAAKIKSASRTIKPAVPRGTKLNDGRSVRMPQWTAQLNVAPALGHFIKPPMKTASSPTSARTGSADKKTISKAR